MKPIIETLFEAVHPLMQSKAERKAMASAEAAVHLVEQRLTEEEFNQLWYAVMEINQVRQQESFARGFRLGMQTALEGLRPISLD